MKRPSPEEIFLDSLKSLIQNMLVDNPNYKGDYYFKDSSAMNTVRLINDTKEIGNYILGKIDEWSHLVTRPDNDQQDGEE